MIPTFCSAPADFSALETPLLVVALAAGAPVPGELGAVDRALGGALGRALARRDFRGTRDETLFLAGGDVGVQRVLLVGTGKGWDPLALRRAGAIAARRALALGSGALAFYAAGAGAPEAEAIAVGLAHGAWKFEELKSLPPEDERRAPLTEAVILGHEAVNEGVRTGSAIAEGYAVARRLAMLPGNVCTPDLLAETARDIGQRHGMQVTVLGRAEMTELGMGSFLCVAQGTTQDPKLIALEHRKGKGGKPLVLVGKGLCFDSGGISIKPAQGMEMMKFDMCGAAGVLGAMEAIARLGLEIDVIGLVGSTTNMPSGEAVKPGDVVRAMNGKSIEIINTDAEGRLVLADVLGYAKRYDPAAVIDAATLTGAIVIALGHTAVGVFGNDPALVSDVLAAGTRAGEPGWELPMWEDFKELVKSDVADIKNSGGRAAGSITAALFLQEFVDDFPWVHLDIAGTAYSESDLGTIPRGPTGTPVGTFVEFVRSRA